MRRAVIYARVSSDRQAEEGWSHDAQVERLRAYAEREGLEVVAEVIATESAKQAGRKAWRRVLDLLRSPGGPRVLLVEKADRATRNLRDFLELDELRQGDVEIHSTREGLVISRDCEPSVELMWMLQVSFARHYVANLSAEAKKGMRQARRSGRWTHRAPFGWRNARENGRATLVPHEEEAAEVRRLFREYLAGRVAVSDLAASSPLGKTAVHKALRNPLHAGLVPTDEGLVEGAHEGLISPADWYEAQARLNRRARRHEGPAGRAFPYAGGLFLCGDCGRQITGGWSRGRSRLYPHLWCPGRCSGTVRVEAVEDQLAQALEALVIPERHREALRAAVSASVDSQGREVAEESRRLEGALRALQRDERTLYRDRLDGVLEPEEYRRHADEMRRDRARVEARLEAVRRADEDWRELTLRVLDLCCDAPRIWRALEDDRASRRLLVESVSLNRRIRAGIVELDFAQPFETVRAAARTLQATERPMPPEDPRWLPIRDAIRTETEANRPELVALLGGLAA